MERQDLGAWLGLATGGGAAWHIHDGERRAESMKASPMASLEAYEGFIFDLEK